MSAKTTNRKTATNRKTTSKSGKKGRQKNPIGGEIKILGILTACILLAISNFGMGGAVGEAVSSVLFGIFGFMNYILPFLLFGGILFLLANRGNRHAYIKAAAAAVCFLVMTALLELLFHGYDSTATIVSIFLEASQHRNVGGVAGGCITHFLSPLIGEIGAYVVLLILFVICVILITERSLLAPLGRQGKKAYASMKKKTQETVALRARKKAELTQEAKQSGTRETDPGWKSSGRTRKTSGVSFATTLSEEDGYRRKVKSPEVYELKPDFETEMMDREPPFVISRAEPSGGEETDPGMEGEKESDEYRPGLSGARSAAGTRILAETEGTLAGVAREEITEGDPEGKGGSKKRRSTARTAAEAAAEAAVVEEEVQARESRPVKKYQTPPTSLLRRGKKNGGDSDAHLRATALKLEQTLQNFGVGVHVTNASCGPSVTRYELQPDQGVKVSRIVGLADDIKLNLAVADLRIEAPIPGKAAVGIEVPNSENTAVMLRDLLESKEFRSGASPISFAVGKDIAGKVVVADIARMPHLLIAGATGSGKSVCINTLIMSIIYKANPEDVKLILVDPKVVELSVYNGIPHLMIPVVTDPKKAAGALNWAVAEMEKRYKLFADYNVRDLKGFNEKVERGETGEEIRKKLPQIVIVIDELADLMMVAPGEVESAICRLAQLARAAGLHLILATQRPSVNVITGLIKANMPSRIAFSVSSGVDSRTIIDMNGAEKLLGKGDMLFYPSGYPKPVRVQGSFVSDEEVQAVVDFLISRNGKTDYDSMVEAHIVTSESGQDPAAGENGSEQDAYFAEAGKLIIDKEKASIGMLQRMFKIGFNRAARIMDQLAEAGVVGPEEGTKPRKILMTKEEFDQYIENRAQQSQF